MAIHVMRRQRVDRTVAMRELREDWWQLRKAVQAQRPEAVLWRLQRVQKTKGMHRLTLAEMLVGSGTIR